MPPSPLETFVSADLTPAPGRRTQTISPYARTALVSRDLTSTAPCPSFATMANAPLVGQDGGSFRFDLPDEASGIFLREGLDRLLVICPSCCFVAVRHEVSACTGSDTVPGEPNVCSKIRPSIGLVATAASGPRSRCVPMGGTVAYFVSANGPKKRPQRADAARAAARRAKNSTAWAGSRSQKQKDPDQQTCCKCPEA